MNEEILKLIKNHEKLIFKIASKFFGIDIQDLFQVGVIGLIKASRNFKSDGTAKFSTYAYDYIFGEMYNLSMISKNIKLNKDTLKLCRKIEEAKESLQQIIKRIPTNTELAHFLEIDEELINNVEMATAEILSLDESALYQMIPEDNPIKIDNRIIIDESMTVLSDEEKNIINCRYFKDYSQSETAKILGLTQASVSRYEKRGLQKMNEYITS